MEKKALSPLIMSCGKGNVDIYDHNSEYDVHIIKKEYCPKSQILASKNGAKEIVKGENPILPKAYHLWDDEDSLTLTTDKIYLQDFNDLTMLKILNAYMRATRDIKLLSNHNLSITHLAEEEIIVSNDQMKIASPFLVRILKQDTCRLDVDEINIINHGTFNQIILNRLLVEPGIISFLNNSRYLTRIYRLINHNQIQDMTAFIYGLMNNIEKYYSTSIIDKPFTDTLKLTRKKYQ